MATISLTIPDAAVAILVRRYPDVPAWLLNMAVTEAKQIRHDAVKRELPEMLTNEAFLNDLVSLVATHRPRPTP